MLIFHHLFMVAHFLVSKNSENTGLLYPQHSLFHYGCPVVFGGEYAPKGSKMTLGLKPTAWATFSDGSAELVKGGGNYLEPILKQTGDGACPAWTT